MSDVQAVIEEFGEEVWIVVRECSANVGSQVVVSGSAIRIYRPEAFSDLFRDERTLIWSRGK